MYESHELSGWLAGTLGLASGYLVKLIFDRRKFNAETKSVELDADTKAVELFERYASQLKPRIEELEVRQSQLSDEVANLRIENAKLHMENERLKDENTKLQTQVDTMNREIISLRSSIKNHEHKTPTRRGPQKPRS
jgi:FtsZ-binding cell division protein ZapB